MFQNKVVYCWQRIKCNNQAINKGCLLRYIKRQIKKTAIGTQKPSVNQCQTDDKENWAPLAVRFSPAACSYKRAIKDYSAFVVNSAMQSIGTKKSLVTTFYPESWYEDSKKSYT